MILNKKIAHKNITVAVLVEYSPMSHTQLCNNNNNNYLFQAVSWKLAQEPEKNVCSWSVCFER